ncbi:hypothetical protein KCP78_15630 [Salmonella enterica subsp. enterica]|nr:hypothetical protein KCP78_15630 [Salmonella enterica subsp. enterica]
MFVSPPLLRMVAAGFQTGKLRQPRTIGHRAKDKTSRRPCDAIFGSIRPRG